MFRPKKTVLHLRMVNFNNHLLDQSWKAFSPNCKALWSSSFMYIIYRIVTFVRCCCCVTYNATSMESISNINTHTLSKFSIHATTLSDSSACTDSNLDCLSCCHWTKPKSRIQGCAVQRQRLHCSSTAIAYRWNKSIALQRSNNMLIAIRSRSSSLTTAVTAKRHQSCHEGRTHVTRIGPPCGIPLMTSWHLQEVLLLEEILSNYYILMLESMLVHMHSLYASSLNWLLLILCYLPISV